MKLGLLELIAVDKISHKKNVRFLFGILIEEIIGLKVIV